MRYLSLILLVLIAYQINGQDNNFYELAGPDNFYPDNFNKVPGVRMVIVKTDCQTCSPRLKQEHSETYFFNAGGYNVEQNLISKGRKWGVEKFFWNPDGTVSRYQGYSSYKGTLDILEDSATYENDYGMAWDSTALTKEIRYTYERNKKLKTITWLDGEDLSTESVITFYYNTQGKVIKEELVDFPDKGDIILGFKPNSTTEIIEKPDAKKQITNYKLFKYLGDTVLIKYYKNGTLSGKGKQAFNKRGLLTYMATYNLNGELLFQIKNIFNEKGKPIDQRIFQTGYDGYGNGGDFAGGDRRTFEYDKSGRLIKVVEYFGDEVFSIDIFEYK
jgi:hypothetical protein